MRGSSAPLVVLLTSKSAVLCGLLVPMPTFCALENSADRNATEKKNIFFMGDYHLIHQKCKHLQIEKTLMQGSVAFGLLGVVNEL
jgi:hypothetical protein